MINGQPADMPVRPPDPPAPTPYILDIKPGMTQQEATYLAITLAFILTGKAPPRFQDRLFNIDEETANRIFEVSMRHFEPMKDEEKG